MRVATWQRETDTGCEFAEIDLRSDRLTAQGVAIGSLPVPYRLDYLLETGEEFVTTLLDVTSRGQGWERTLLLRGDGKGSWTIDAHADGSVDLPAPGGDSSALGGLVDCDLGLSPVTNLMPIMRHDLVIGEGCVELNTAWVSVPDLRVLPDGQRYTAISANKIRYEALDGSFSALITVDDDGVVVDYPGIAHQI
jgi:uncharacterized protein